MNRLERCVYLQLLDTTIMTKYGDNDEDFRRYLTALRAYVMQEQPELPLGNLWRVQVYPSGTFRINDFTMPSNTGKMRETFKQENLPRWIQDSLSVLMIVDQGVTVEGVGKKITDSIFYLLETPEIGEIYGNKT